MPIYYLRHTENEMKLNTVIKLIKVYVKSF